MECNCNDTNKQKAEIRHVFGNVLRLAIPLTLRSLAKEGDTIVATDTDFVPSSAYPVNVVFSRGNKALPIPATMDGNVAVMEDFGTIPVGTYDITVECRDDAGRPYRFKQRTVLQVVEYTADAGIEQEIEYEAKTWYLDAAIFLATTEIGSVEAEIDARLATVFGDADYDAQNRRFVFYNKSRSAILCEVDATPFVRDGMVENFYLDTSRNVLVIVLNSDGGRRTMTVPLYMAFADYYNRAEVNSRISEEIEAAIRDIDIDTSTLMTLAEYTYKVEYPEASVNIKYSVLPPTAVDFIEDIGEAESISGGEVFATSNGHIREASYFGNTFDLGLVTKQAILNKADGLFYRYDSINGWVQVGGSGSGGGDGTVTAVKMNNGQPIEPNAQGVVDLGTVITAHQDISGKANSADLATVATSGSYNDLTDKPTIPAAYDDTTLSGRVSALENAGYVTSSTMTTALASKQDTLTFDNAPTANSNNPVKSSGIKTYVDGKATITGITTSQDGTFTITQSDGNSFTVDLNHTHPQYVEGNDLADVATSGDYDDLTNKPTIPAAQVQSDWDATSGMGVILNKPTIPSKTSDLTNDSGYINKSVFTGTCSTAAATMPKVCTVDTFPTTESNGVTHAADGTMIAVMFTNSDTNTSAAPTLNVNNIGAKAIYYSNAKVTSTAKNTTIAGTANVLAYYYYDSSLDEGNGAWVYMGKSADSNSTYSQASLGQGYAVQSNSAAATAITASISSYALGVNGIVTIKFTYDVPANATLNISSKGAKAIYNKGAAIQAGVIKAGETATFIYSTYYHLISVDSWQDNQGSSVTVDSTPTSGSTNAVSSGGVYTALAGKADTSTTYTKSEIDTKIGNIETLLASI